MDEYISIFKALSDQTRMRIVNILLRSREELCVCEIVYILEIAQYNVSRHLKELEIAGIIKERKDGRFVVCSIVKSKNVFHRCILKALGSLDSNLIIEDRKRLNKRLSLRENGKCIIGAKNKMWGGKLNVKDICLPARYI